MSSSYSRYSSDTPSRPSSTSSFNSESNYSSGNNSYNNSGRDSNRSGPSKSPFQRYQQQGGSSGSGDRPSNNSYNSNPTGSRDFNNVPAHLMSSSIASLGLSSENMEPILKDFYKEHPTVQAMTVEDVKKFRAENQMTIDGKDVPNPIEDFNQAGFVQEIEKKITMAGFAKPTPIQSQGWPMALSGKNMVGIAQTGSGKTLSFALPALTHIMGQRRLDRGDGPIALVLAPTRELAVQIQEVCRLYANALRINSTCLYGGASKGNQIRAIRNGCELVVATPGRLLDLLDANIFTLERCSFLVLDEADRMLDMGFEPQLRQILQRIRVDRQVLMWSATWPKSVRNLAHDMLGKDFIQVKIGSSELQANKKIMQIVKVTSNDQKLEEVQNVLKESFDALPAPENGKEKQMVRTIIFCNTKRAVDNIEKMLYRDYWPVVAIHGDKSQNERDYAIRMLKSGEVSILVATDVAARGLDVKDIMIVINYDLPNDIEDYVHRIGRTARGDSTEGTSYSFLTHDDSSIVGDLVKIMEDAGQTVSEEVKRMRPTPKYGRGNSYGKRSFGGYGGGGSRGGRGGHRRF